MNKQDIRQKLRDEMASVQVSAPLRQRTLAAAGKEPKQMKRKMSLSLAIALALSTLLCCAVAIAAVNNRWGMLDFVNRYSSAHYIPEDAQDYVRTEVLAMENDQVTICIRELYYDGRIARMTADVTPKVEKVLLVGEGVYMEDPFVNLTRTYVTDGDNDMRSVYQVIQEEGYTQVYAANVSLLGAGEDMIGGSMDFILGEDGTLTIYAQEEYRNDLLEREVTISAIIMPFDQPLTPQSEANYDRRAVLETPVTLTASDRTADAADKADGNASVYISEAPAAYPSAGVIVDRVILEVKPLEIYATVEYTITDTDAYDRMEGGLFFEFIDTDKDGAPYEQRLAEGLSGSAWAAPAQEAQETATKYCQRETLGRNELHETYQLRAFNAWDKTRFETCEIAVRPATEEERRAIAGEEAVEPAEEEPESNR